MIIKTLYRYFDGNNIIDTYDKPVNHSFTERYRLIADEDKMLTVDGIEHVTVIDIDKDSRDSWYELERCDDLLSTSSPSNVSVLHRRLDLVNNNE